jgi:transposase
MDTVRRPRKRRTEQPRKRRIGRSEPLKWRVTDRLWERLAPLLADPPRRFRYPGRARYPARACLEGILYVLYTDTPWLQVPYRELGLPSGETCRRRLEEWQRRGLLAEAIRVLQEELAGADRLDWSRVIVDASLVEAKKGATRSPARSWAGRAAATT